MSGSAEKFKQTRENFVSQWGVMGSQWGINRTMAQIHALLMTAVEPLSTDEVMAELDISRGNAHTNLKELVNWGLLRIVTKKGERREFFEAEKDVWEMFRLILRERKRRELDPALAVLTRCKEESEGLECEEAKAFHQQMADLEEFLSFASKMSDRASSLPQNKAMQTALKILG
ncbi:GbsR/MarR family transcriptional regulator [Roseibacillus ishigakijimensis]|uniref:HTH-type transcriptional regulator n=1 Tax=Roseibacillus ishigakijimensis TaxID=454146 RepID=A0A934VL83_9BACT|nr:MarR family transcriptional regulator [Roseibacillus ishigakijimensis]MBK1832610.1 transcriptional regulator [Roseibacillus ishigakijimensis]